jgi:glycosyltransferase involved in cell wall biosynthesis
MLISVITVAYNSANTIGDTLDSVSSQTYPKVQHVVIDGCSTDGTLNIIKTRGKHVETLVSEKDEGIYDAMNKGLGHATGDIVGFLNSDDVFADQNALERIASAFQDRGVDLVYGDLVFVAQTNLTRSVRLWTSRRYEAGLCSRGWMPPHPTFYVRRSVYEKFGGYDLDFPAAADFEMALRLLDCAKLNSVYIPSIQIRMRMGGQSTRSIKNILSGSREVSRACKKHGLPGGVRFAISRLLAKVPQFFQRPRL